MGKGTGSEGTRGALNLHADRGEPAERPLPNLFGEAAGLSTGWHPAHRGDLRAAVTHARRFATGTVELSALSTRDLPSLCAYLSSPHAERDLQAFAHVSVHAPSKHLPDDWTDMVAQLRAVDGLVAGMVMHPDTFADQHLPALRTLGGRLVVENMDCRKADCRTAQELQRIFAALPQARFCLDVAHAWTIDPSLAEGHRLLDAFGDRLVEVHTSGINPDGKHRPTTDADLERYRPLLERCTHVPWVYESPYVGR